jgi:putative SOS response-associated peptidase YedK
MPAILLPDTRDLWLNPDLRDEHELTKLLAPYPSNQMTARPVSRLVNDPKHDSAELLA